MKPRGKIIAVAGSDPKAGASMVAKSLAQYLAKETGEAILYLERCGKARVIAPWNDAEMTLTEAGLSHLLGAEWEEASEEMRERFAFTLSDTGTEEPCEADRLVLVVNQLASSLKAAERSAPAFEARFGGTDGLPGNGKARRLLCLNRYLPGDPHDAAYVRRIFPGWEILLVPESPRGREADWEGVTIPSLGDRPYRRAVKEGVKWILNS